MISIDTSVLVRFLLRDDEPQALRARHVVETQDVRLLLTVVLEAAWVLRSGSDLSYRDIASQIRAFAGLPSVTVEDAPRFHRAMDMVDEGMDFADAIHLSALEPEQAFSTFDAKLIRVAQRLGYSKVLRP